MEVLSFRLCIPYPQENVLWQLLERGMGECQNLSGLGTENEMPPTSRIEPRTSSLYCQVIKQTLLSLVSIRRLKT